MNSSVKSRSTHSLGILLAVCLAWSNLSVAQENISFSGKSVTMTIGNAAGGATDIYGRLIGRYLIPRLPGQPGVIVVNQPGAGGVVALNAWGFSSAK